MVQTRCRAQDDTVKCIIFGNSYTWWSKQDVGHRTTLSMYDPPHRPLLLPVESRVKELHPSPRVCTNPVPGACWRWGAGDFRQLGGLWREKGGKQNWKYSHKKEWGYRKTCSKQSQGDYKDKLHWSFQKICSFGSGELKKLLQKSTYFIDDPCKWSHYLSHLNSL